MTETRRTRRETEKRSVRGDLTYLISTFPAGTRARLIAYCVLQFFVSFLDLVGVAAVLPVMQVLSGSSMNTGYLGTIHEILGLPTRNIFVIELCGLMVLAFALKTIGAIVIAWWSSGVVARLQVLTSTRLLDSYLGEDFLQQRRREDGEVIRTVGSSVAAAHFMVLGGVLSLFGQLLSMIFIAVLLAAVAPVVTGLAVVYLGLVVAFVQRRLGRRNRESGKVAQRTSYLMSRALLQSIHGAREVRMHDARVHFVHIFRDATHTNAQASRRANFYSQAPKYVLEFTTILGLAILLAATAVTGNASGLLPVLAVFVAAAVKLLPVVTAFSVTVGNIRFGEDGLALTVDALRLARPSDGEWPASPQGAMEPPIKRVTHPDYLVVDDVRFRYPGATHKVLKGISFRVPPGDSLAVCGVSGSGKTTLVNIILGLIPPESGSVRYGSMDIAHAGRKWRDEVAYVPQDIYMLEAPLWANVAFGIGKDYVDKERVARCVADAEIGDLLEGRDGIETIIGSAGIHLSGGQRQRVGIARALYRNAGVMIFDEATSALDNDTEDRVGDVIRNLHGKVTTIMVAHRLSSIRHVDRIVYLEQGLIADSGSFDDLRRTSASFDRLVRLGDLSQ